MSSEGAYSEAEAARAAMAYLSALRAPGGLLRSAAGGFRNVGAWQDSAWEEDPWGKTQCVESSAGLPVRQDVCTECGAKLCRSLSDLEQVCIECGVVVFGDSAEPDDEATPQIAPSSARLRIVGPNSSQLQPDLYRSSSGAPAASQRKQIYDEFCAYRAMHIENGGKAFPLDACSRAGDLYNVVRQSCVKRALIKKNIMAACLYTACIVGEFAPTKADVADFMQLRRQGIAKGTNFMRSLAADGKMGDAAVDVDPTAADICTLFVHLKIDSDAFAPLKLAVREIIETANANFIGGRSVLRSKVAGATYIAICRSSDDGLAHLTDIAAFCGEYIRKNTVEQFVDEVDAYLSVFTDCFRRFGLEADRKRSMPAGRALKGRRDPRKLK
jgi:hypothetical protein